MQFRAIVADDHPLFRSALKQALTQSIGEAIGETASLEETVSMLNQHDSIELVFLDVNMPGNQGLTGLSHIRHHFPDVLVVMVSADESPGVVNAAMNLGASGYVPKSAPLEMLSQAVATVLEGEQWLPQELRMSTQQNEDEQSVFAEKLSLLTPHQFTVLKMMADGLLNKQIAYELGVKETTIKQHGSAILRKLGVVNRTQAGVLFKQVMGAES